MPVGTTNDPTAVRALLNLPPAGTDPYSSTGQLYFANQANLDHFQFAERHRFRVFPGYK